MALLTPCMSPAETQDNRWKVLYPEYPPASSYSIKGLIDLKGGRYLVLADPGCFLTTDGGSTWSYVDTGLSGSVNGAFFLDSTKGWLWSSGEVAFTYDGGATWATLSEMPWKDRGIAEGLFVTGKVGFFRSYYGDLVRTEDGGRTWTKIPAASLPQTIGRTIFFSNTTTGIRVAGADVYRTEDAGKTWTRFHKGETKVQAACSSGTYGIVIEEFGDTFYTADGGRTWKEGEIKPFDALADMHFTADCQAVGASKKGLVYLSNDHGRTWNVIDARQQVQGQLKDKPVNQAVLKVLTGSQPGLKTFALVGYGYILKTHDAGRSWSVIPVPGDVLSGASHDATIVSMLNPNIVAFSDDLGATWRKIISANENALAAAELENGTGYAVTNNGTIIKSSKRGEPWQPFSELLIPGERIWTSAQIAFLDDLHGVVYANARYLYTTHDGGKKWKLLLDLFTAPNLEVSSNYNYEWRREITVSYDRPRTITLTGLHGYLAQIDAESGNVVVMNNAQQQQVCAQRSRAHVWKDRQTAHALLAGPNSDESLSFWDVSAGGKSCKKLSLLPVSGYVKTLSIEGRNAVIAIHTRDQRLKYLRSSDGGRTWEVMQLPREASEIVRISAKKGGMITLLDDSNRLWTYGTKERTWTSREVARYRSNGRAFPVGGSRWTNSYWMTFDQGKTWRRPPRLCNKESQFGTFFWDEAVTFLDLEERFGECRNEIRSYGSMRAFVFPERDVLIDEMSRIYHVEKRARSLNKVGALFDVPEKERQKPGLGQIAFVDKDHGCASGTLYRGEQMPESGLFCTKDGGKIWKKARVEKADDEQLMQSKEDGGDAAAQAKVLAAFTGFKGIMSAVFQLVDVQNGWAVVKTFARNTYLVRTTDGGAQWRMVSVLNGASREERLNILSELSFVGFTDDKRGFIGGSSFLSVTEDGGRTFQRVDVPKRFGSISQLVIDRRKAYVSTEKAILEFVGATDQK